MKSPKKKEKERRHEIKNTPLVDRRHYLLRAVATSFKIGGCSLKMGVQAFTLLDHTRLRGGLRVQ